MEASLEKMKKPYEGPSEWKLRKLFLLKNYGSGFSSDRLECLSNCFVYGVLYGVSYPQPVMDEVKKLSDGIVSQVFPTGLPSYRGSSTSRNETAQVPSKPANPSRKVAKGDGSSKEVAKNNAAKFPSLDSSDRQWMSVKNYEKMVRIAGPKFRPIHFVKASAGGVEDDDDENQSLCFPSLKSNESMLNYNPHETSKSADSSKPPQRAQGLQNIDARATSPPVSSAVTKIVLTLQRLFETWLIMSEKTPKMNCAGALNNAASKSHIPMQMNVERQNSKIGLVGFVCTITMTEPSTGATVILSDGSARSKKEAKYLASFRLLKFRDGPIEVHDLKPDSAGENCYRLIHDRITKKPPLKTPRNASSIRTVAPTTEPVQQRAPQSAPQSTPQVAVQVVKRRIPRRSESAVPKSVYLKEIAGQNNGPIQILATTGAMHSKKMEMESLSDGSHSMRFLGQVWGPLTGMASPLKAKRVLAEAAVGDLRRDLWTLRIRQMPDFSALQDVVGVQKETAVRASEEIRCEDAPLDGGNVGHRLLRQMGWNTGKGLGKDEEGRKVPVSTDMTLIKRQGLGLKIGNAAGIGAFRQYIVQRLREFYDAGVNAEDLCFSSDFDNQERALIHQQCRGYPNLESRSFNTADGNRFLVVMRKRSPKELLDWVIAKGCSTMRYEAFPPGLHPELDER